jgi:hypothetical protein
MSMVKNDTYLPSTLVQERRGQRELGRQHRWIGPRERESEEVFSFSIF